MTDIPNKPVSSGVPGAAEWNRYQAGLIIAEACAIQERMRALANMASEFVTGGSSVEWEVAWSDVRFAERTALGWEMNREVSRRESELRFSPPPQPTPPSSLPVVAPTAKPPEQEPEQ